MSSSVPCPPFYSTPTHQYHPNYAEGSFVRQYNDWYECLVYAYCNSPTFLGYNPPGEGKQWTLAWTKLDEGFPCNPNLDDGGSTSGSSSSNNNNDNNNKPLFDNPFSIVITPPPTPSPTRIKETPSLISGVVWYDANGDGRKNTLQNALTTEDREASSEEHGGGIGNMRVTLRKCETDELVGVTYTFPRTLASGANSESSSSAAGGGIAIVHADYLSENYQQQLDTITYGGGGGGGGNGQGVDTELGFGNVNNELGYYSFRVLPSYLPGNFYVVFEAPEGYRLSSGSGDYWEVHEAALNDAVQPVMEATWNKKNSSSGSSSSSSSSSESESGRNGRYLQVNYGNNDTENNGSDNNNINNNTTTNNYSNFTIPIIPSIPDKLKLDPINHSGYYARSKGCIFIKESPKTVPNNNYGLTKDSWPLISFQYASFVVIIEFFAPVRRRGLQHVDSLECRKYQKLKGEGVEVEDIWGCETPLDIGGGKQFDFTLLTVEQCDFVVNTLRDFLISRASRVWSITNVHLAYQDVIQFNTTDRRRLEESSSSSSSLRGDNLLYEQDIDDNNNNNNRALQNQQLAQLELGIRVRAEIQSDKAKTQDLTDVLMSSIGANPTAVLSTMKANVNVMPPYFRVAGGLTIRRILWKPTPSPTPAPSVDVMQTGDAFPIPAVNPPTQPSQEIGGGQMMMIIGIVAALVVVVVAGIGTIVGMYMWRKRQRQKDGKTKGPGIQGANARLGLQKQKGFRFNISDDEEDYDDDDSLSSRWYSDYEGSDRDDDESSDYVAEDSFGAFDETGPPNLNNLKGMRESMRQSVKSSALNSSRRSSFQSQSSSGGRGSVRGSMRGSMQSSAKSSMRSSVKSSMRYPARSSMQSSARASMRSTGRSSMHSSARSSVKSGIPPIT